MPKYKIIFDREACIGALACIVISPELWLLASDGKVDLADSKFNSETKKYELIVNIKDKSKFEEIFNSEKHCPVVAIKLEKIEE